MGTIDEMLREMCPTGVEWKKLGEVCNRNKGMNITAQLMKKIAAEEGDVQVFAAGNNNVMAFRKDLPNTNIITAPAILVKSRGNIGFEYVTIPFTHKNELWSYTKAKDCIELKYVFYYLQNLTDEFQFKARANSVKLPQLCVADTDDFLIPLPPLSVQLRIVGVLDLLTGLATELQAELQAELRLRRQQYEYYRTRLLTFDKGAGNAVADSDCAQDIGNQVGNTLPVEWRRLGDVCKRVVSGGTPARNRAEYFEGTIPWLRTQEVDYNEVLDTEIHITEDAVKNSSAKLIPANCVIVAMYGATAGKACINKIALTTNQACCNLEIDSACANYKYVYYWICNEYNNIKSLGEGSQNNINMQKLKSYSIPLPSFAEQERIVGILDKFEGLVNGMESGLPAEIALVEKQYAYYREKLLQFGA